MGKRRGILVIISSPSGAGKTTLARRLLGEFSQVRFSVSYTTRPPRPGEQNDIDYHFVSDEKFDEMIGRGAFAEWAHVHGNRYGTSRDTVENALTQGIDVVFDVDWQGARALVSQWPKDALMLFILPPDLVILEERLRRRATDSNDVIARRLKTAIEELEHFREYQFALINDDLDRSYGELKQIYSARVDAAIANAEWPTESKRPAAVDAHAQALIAEGRRKAKPS